MPTNKPTDKINIKKIGAGPQRSKRKPGTGMSPGELKAKTGKTKITRKRKDNEIKPMKPKPLDRKFDKPFKEQMPISRLKKLKKPRS